MCFCCKHVISQGQDITRPKEKVQVLESLRQEEGLHRIVEVTFSLSSTLFINVYVLDPTISTLRAAVCVDCLYEKKKKKMRSIGRIENSF